MASNANRSATTPEAWIFHGSRRHDEHVHFICCRTPQSKMTSVNRAAFLFAGAAAAIASLVVGAIAFVGLGIYDIGADDHHTKVVLAIIEQLRERSIVARKRGIVVPNLTDSEMIAAGGQRYATLCAECHLAPGVSKSVLRTGLYPYPPNLAQEEVLDAQHTFWVIKHGIKMSAMPAWGKTQDDMQIWELVAFVRQLPQMTPESYASLSGVRRPSER